MITDATTAADRSAARAPTVGENEEEALDILAVIEAMGTHFHEHHDDVVRWSWKLFCAKWARLSVQVAEQERDRRQREREREEQRRWQEFRDRQNAGSGGW